MTNISPNQRPYKVWSCNRETRKSVVAASLSQFKLRAAEKLNYEEDISSLRVVLDVDGTEVEDDDYFQTAEKDTVFLLLKSDERWLPPGVEALRAAIKAIPTIVCDAITRMELTDKYPSWKIMDEKGNISVILNWDQRERVAQRDSTEPSSWRVEVVTSPPTESKAQFSSVKSSTAAASTSRANLIYDGFGSRPSATTTLPFRTLSMDEDDEYDYDGERIEQVYSPNHDHDHSLCDFHCAAFHRSGGQITVNRSAATSPIREFSPTTGLGVVADSGVIPKKTSVKGHVRFVEEEPTKIPAENSDEETETITEKDNEPLSERYLLLVDQQERHLSVKDIGTILERLSAKIVDIERLEREKESQECYNWVIKATIRGEVLREIGVIYNGHYYGIMEHPGYF